MEPTYADVYYSTQFQLYSLIIDEFAAFYYAREDLIEEWVEEERQRREWELRTMPYHAYLQTPEWRALATRAKARAGYRCMFCNSGGELHAHHRTYDRRGHEADDDVVALCAVCHRRLEGID